MQTKYLLALGLSLGLGMTNSVAQTVLTVGKDAVSKTEFLSWYQKNNPQNLKYDKASLNDFANLYALYKMKVLQANELQLDTIPNIKADIEMYKMQLAKNYIADKRLEEKLLREAYIRTKTERKVAHILVNGFGAQMENQNRKMLDSLSAAIRVGEISFEDAAKKFSSDKGSSEDGGNIGFINAMQTPYDFETEAYTIPVGGVSKPFKTIYGYHIIKVLDERPAAGTYKVAQILLTANMNDKADVQAKIDLANEIKTQVLAGKSFESMVSKYSEDEFSKSSKGIIAPIKTGSTAPDIEQAVFSLQKSGEMSVPVVSSFGVHLFQLVSKVPFGTYEQEKDSLKVKVDQKRMDVLRDQNLVESKKTLGFIEDKLAFASLVDAVDQNDFVKGNTLGAYPQLKANLFEIAKKQYSQQDFLAFIEELTRGKLSGNKGDALTELYRVYTEKMLNDAQLKKLEQSNPDFLKLANEYRNGVLIFDMMDKNIWSKANQDTTGLMNFYRTNQAKYVWKPGFKGVVFQSKNHQALQQIQAALSAGANVEQALAKVNTPTTDEKIYQQTGRFDFEHLPEVSRSMLVENSPSSIVKDGSGNEVVVLPEEIYDTPQEKTFVEARDVVVDDYQKVLEKQWDSSLKAKYPLKINKTVLDSMIK